ncbi:MAG: PilZ domain-containing protein [Treponema sp.]|jgi:hypothetical protein|nr:PilZ domain-containing protein [Treponema sp.]
MIFGRKKENAEENVVRDQRREPRYNAVARIRVNGFEGEAVLRDINNTGFQMESRTYAAIMVGERYNMQIVPENMANIPPIDLEVEVRWVRNAEVSFNSGFLITSRPSDNVFDKYMIFIKTRYTVQSGRF